MNFSPTVLGTPTANKLALTATTPVLEVGRDRLTRGQLAAVGCYNFIAATRLTGILRTELEGVTSLRQLFDKVSPTDLALPRIGAVSLAVLGAAWEVKGIGGDNPLEAWVRHHASAQDGRKEVVTFFTVKARHAAEEARQKQADRAARRKKTPDPIPA